MIQCSMFDEYGEPVGGRKSKKTDDYNEFVDKFKPKLTTDDCYTPPIVYDAVADYVAEKYQLDRDDFVRPFYPGGDYESFEYDAGCVVVDNPPFSILSQIIKFYTKRGIRFFLFAPALTTFGTVKDLCCAVCANCQITYENGAVVNTNFVTNMSANRAETAPELYKRVNIADKINTSQGKTELPKYEYPYEVLTAARMNYIAKYGIELAIPAEETAFIRMMDAQYSKGKAIFGGGYLLSERAAAERAAAERAAAERWELSPREKEIIARLKRDD